ncbi:LacI family DNA-binding transcriptional regulator [Arthrobacter sp. ISL-48]|uniref:LacI family DNA-binding transcriptional regulator n=1 Tax=Arthrobacter sp. ISL-48 TaxID=2819110 RepID=UPI00203553CF|nr:substrate-binding domain-containing protein [Arthrobacter sp. ISL-48]
MTTKKPQQQRSPVIDDVARLAGVSVPTVSRVLTGAAKVSEAKREAVMNAITLLKYRPSAAARSVASRRSSVIAVIAGNTSRYGYAETIRGVEEAARARGYIVSITVVDSTEDDDVERAVSLVVGQDLAGIVALKFDPPGVAALQRLPDHIPTVAISGVRETHVPQAVLDEASAAAELTDFLLNLGHGTVHHVRVPPSRREDGRTAGWRRALRKAGAVIPPAFDASWQPESGRAIGQALAKDESVTAVFCGNDEIAMGVIRGLADEGLRTPEDVSVVGFDNHPLSGLWTPSLTTAHQDFFGLGQRGFELLMAQVSGEPGARRFSSERPALVIRASAAAPSSGRGRSDLTA